MARKYQGIDFYDVDGLLDEEERMIRDTVRQWVEDRVIPLIGEAYVERRFPTEIIPELAELGMLGANLPEEYGCAGLNNVAYGLINQELERGRLRHPFFLLGAGRLGHVSHLRLRE